jgi:hypothetical protein
MDLRASKESRLSACRYSVIARLQANKGYLIEAFTAIRSFSGLKGALKALKTTEEITNRYYGEVVSWEAPTAVKEVLRKYFSEEKVHLGYISNNLQTLT